MLDCIVPLYPLSNLTVHQGAETPIQILLAEAWKLESNLPCFDRCTLLIYAALSLAAPAASKITAGTLRTGNSSARRPRTAASSASQKHTPSDAATRLEPDGTTPKSFNQCRHAHPQFFTVVEGENPILHTHNCIIQNHPISTALHVPRSGRTTGAWRPW